METPIKKELVITVDLGPFKHTVDNGASIRKAAFNLLETLTEQFAFNQSLVIDAIITGTVDTNEDVQIMCLGFLNKLLAISPMIVVSKVDAVVEKFQAIYQKNCNNLKKEDEAENTLNLMRAVLRVCEGLNRNQEAVGNISFQQWFSMCVTENHDIPSMRQLYEKIVSNAQQILWRINKSLKLNE